jgi:hypothetical protein
MKDALRMSLTVIKSFYRVKALVHGFGWTKVRKMR